MIKYFCFGIFVLIFFSECQHKEIVRYSDGTKRMMTVKDRNMQLKQSKSWYQSGKVKSDFVILALDTVIVFDSIVNDSIIWVDIKKSGKQWHENGTIEQVHSVLSDGSRKIIFYNPAGIPCSEEIYLNNRMIKRDVISNCDSVGVK